MASLFDLEETLAEDPAKKYEKAFRKAEIHLIREEYAEAKAIYDEILAEDMDVGKAYVGLLRVHSKDYTVFEGDEIEKTLRILAKLFPDYEDEDLSAYLEKRKAEKKKTRGNQSSKGGKPKKVLLCSRRIDDLAQAFLRS